MGVRSIGSATEPARHPIEEDVNDRRRVESEYLAEQKSTHHDDPERTPQLGSEAPPESQRQPREQSRHRSHHDRAEAEQTGLVDSIGWTSVVLSLFLKREVHHHDSVLLHDADEQNNPDDGDDVEVLMEEHECKQGANTCGGQSGEYGDGMNEAFVQ